MFNKIKAIIIRWAYRLISARAWRGYHSDNNYSVLQIQTTAGHLALRMYAGDSGADKPLIIYFHGGGWVIGDLQTHHSCCQLLSAHTGCTVVSLDYRLAPEHPYPAAHDDALEGTRWIAKHLEELGPNNGQLILAGDSAGANLATCTCLALEDAERTVIAGQLLIYPTTDHYSTHYASSVEKGTGYALTTKMMHWFWDSYIGKVQSKQGIGTGTANPIPVRATPLHASNLATLPATLLVTAENDPIRDQGIAYADKLRANGVDLHHSHFEEAEHGFACTEGQTPDFQRYMATTKSWLESLA
jgi:acetyl esterase